MAILLQWLSEILGNDVDIVNEVIDSTGIYLKIGVMESLQSASILLLPHILVALVLVG